MNNESIRLYMKPLHDSTNPSAIARFSISVRFGCVICYLNGGTILKGGERYDVEYPHLDGYPCWFLKGLHQKAFDFWIVGSYLKATKMDGWGERWIRVE